MIILSIILITAGAFFFLSATIGLLRFPDFYSRLQATGKGDTLGSLLILSGLALYNLEGGLSLESVLVSIKILLIAFFIFIVNPTATHALTRAGQYAGVEPWTKEESGARGSKKEKDK